MQHRPSCIFGLQGNHRCRASIREILSLVARSCVELSASELGSAFVICSKHTPEQNTIKASAAGSITSPVGFVVEVLFAAVEMLL
jgi:hypothetical protein